MTWLLRVLAGQFGGWILAAVGAAFLAIGGYAVAQRLEAASAAVKLAQAEGKNLELQAAVDRQNGEVERLGRECTQKQAEAVTAALRALSAHKKPPAGPGPEHLNRWLADTFSPAP